MASLITAAGSVRASMLDIRVCRCSSTRFSLAVSFRASWPIFTMLKGASCISFPSLVSSMIPWTRSHIPGAMALCRLPSSLVCIYLRTVTEFWLSVMSKVRTHTPGRRVSWQSKKNTLPSTTTVPILGFSPSMEIGFPLMGLPSSTCSALFFPPADTKRSRIWRRS